MSQLTQAENHGLQLKETTSKALSEVNSLSEELEELKPKESLVLEMQKRVEDVEAELDLKQAEVNC